VRPWRAEAFGPTIEPYPSRFVWFGTDLVFDAFTFAFRNTEHGMFQAHAYPFDATTSTFIVECNEQTWRRAGLEGLSEEENIAFCQRLFADELRGHRLLSNRSVWLSFLSVKNESWHDGNVVLLGDAVHTAHFSIGSGTKLAMEDSVALANAFVRHGDAIDAALAEYEMARQPVVERFQEAARESARYFENVARYAGFHPMQFAFNLLTRSGRISYTNLMLRDPYFTRQLDSWFAGNADGRVSGLAAIAPPPIFARLRLPGLELPNRVAQAPRREAATDGVPERDGHDRLVDAARSGGGLVLSGVVAVAPDGRVTPRTPGLYADAQAEAWSNVVADVHEAGARIAVQLGHAGRRGSVRPREQGIDLPLRQGGWPLMSASALPYTAASQVPREMTADDMAAGREAFATAAARAAACGFDALLVHLGHGYLLHSFLSPLSNRREDDYGGPLANRMRFPLEVFDAVRDAWPRERLLGASVSATDWSRRGSDVDEAVTLARALHERGCGLVHVVAGQAVPESRPDYRRGFLTPFSDRIRSDAGVATLVGGYMTTADELNTVVGAGRADLCILDTPELGLVTGVEPEVRR